MEVLKKNIELECKETQVEADRFVKQQIKSLNERNDAAELGQNVQAVAKVAIGVGILAVLFGVG